MLRADDLLCFFSPVPQENQEVELPLLRSVST